MAKEWAKGFYNSKDWQDVRILRIGMDRGLCRMCGRPGNEVDHIIELTPDNINDPEISLNLDNLQTLCHRCHGIKTRGDKGEQINGKILDEIIFDANGMPIKAGIPPVRE